MIQDIQQMPRKKKTIKTGKDAHLYYLNCCLCIYFPPFYKLNNKHILLFLTIVTVVLQVTTLPLTPCPVKDIVVFLAENLLKSRIFHCF